eukprot:UN22869
MMMECERYRKESEALRKRESAKEKIVEGARERIRVLENTLEETQARYQQERITSIDAESRNAMIVEDNRRLYEENRKLCKDARKFIKQSAKHQVVSKERDEFASKLEQMKREILSLQADANYSNEEFSSRNEMMVQEMERM